MIEKILFSLIAFVLFSYIFIFKLIKKNDTTYLGIIAFQSIGILLNFIQILFNILNGWFFYSVIYLFCIIIPTAILLVEIKGINSSELISVAIAKLFYFVGNRKKAKNILLNLVTKYDKSYYAHKMLAEIYQEEGGLRKAIDEYVKVLDIKANDFKSYFKISKLLNELGKKNEAIEMLKNLSKKKPDFHEANIMLGDLLIEKECFKDAINVYTQAIKYNEDNMELYYNLGIAYARINEFSIAKKCFKKTSEIDGEFYNAYYRLGQISLLYRDINEAENYFNQSMFGQTEAKSFYQLSKIYMMKNNKSKAIIYLNKAIEFSREFYEKALDEPMFFSIKNELIKPNNNKEYIESEKEKNISNYLDNTYMLTKLLKEEKNDKNNNKKFNI